MSIHLPEYSLPPPPLEPRSSRTWAILDNQLRERARALNIVLLAFIFIVVILPLVLAFYLSGIVGPGLFGASGASTFFLPYGNAAWFFFLVLLTSSVGAAIIAGDVATRSMTLYLSRPIRTIDYLLAKAGAVGFWLMLGAVVPGCVGTIIVLSLGYASLPLALQGAGGYLLVGALSTLAFTGLALFFSSISAKSVYAGATIFGTLIGTEAVATLLSAISSQSAFLYLSPEEDLLTVARSVYGLSGDPLDPWVAGGLLLGVAVGGFFLAFFRLQRTEVVSE
jgi:ABC-type transport system involved in multi-copper enzyme maturation permease subunit